MKKKDWIMNILMIAAALLPILPLAGRIMRSQAADDAQAREIMAAAQARIDACHAGYDDGMREYANTVLSAAEDIMRQAGVVYP